MNPLIVVRIHVPELNLDDCAKCDQETRRKSRSPFCFLERDQGTLLRRRLEDSLRSPLIASCQRRPKMARLSGKSHKGLTCTLNYRAGQS